MSRVKPDTVLTNARVLTMSPTRPRGEAVAIVRDRIVWVGSTEDAKSFVRSGTTLVDCAGGTLLPGFHDAHIHLLAYASALAGVDCGPDALSSIDDLKSAIRSRASNRPEGEWIRASGYDETTLAEARHPTRRDLDDAAPVNPVRLDHRSGHGCVLNSVALDTGRHRRLDRRASGSDHRPGLEHWTAFGTAAGDVRLLRRQDSISLSWRS